MEHQLQNNSQLLKTLFQNNLYEKAVQEANRKYKIKHYRIEKLKPSGIKNLLKKSSKRQKNLNIEENNYAWAEGQLKIFVWVLVGYVYLKKIDICDMTQKDFDFFTQFFDGYSTDFLNYQAKFLLRSSQKITWSQYEAKLLNEIIKAKFQQKNWNTVAYQLYLNSDKTVFRTPKQCRQRWLNHEDPSKNHSEWTIQQDIELLRFVKCSGKKWSMISKSMKSTRTEHMVKNRFTSLIKKASKSFKSNCERDILDNLLKLKKAQRDRKLTESLNQSSVSDQKTQEPVEQQIEIEEIQHPIQIENCNNENEKQIQYFGPCNLIPELQPENHPGSGSLETDELIDFFEKDNTYPTQKFLDLFF